MTVDEKEVKKDAKEVKQEDKQPTQPVKVKPRPAQIKVPAVKSVACSFNTVNDHEVRIRALEAAVENLTTKNTKDTKNTKKEV